MADGKLKIEIGLAPEATISPADLKNFQRTAAAALSGLSLPSKTISELSGVSKAEAENLKKSGKEYGNALALYAEQLRKLGSLATKEGAFIDPAGVKKTAEDVKAVFGKGGPLYGAVSSGYTKLIQQAVEPGNKQFRTALLGMSSAYDQAARLIRTRFQQSPEFSAGLELLKKFGADPKQIAGLKAGEKKLIQAVKDTAKSVSDEFVRFQRQIRYSATEAQQEIPTQLLERLGGTSAVLKQYAAEADAVLKLRKKQERELQALQEQARKGTRYGYDLGKVPVDKTQEKQAVGRLEAQKAALEKLVSLEGLSDTQRKVYNERLERTRALLDEITARREKLTAEEKADANRQKIVAARNVQVTKQRIAEIKKLLAYSRQLREAQTIAVPKGIGGVQTEDAKKAADILERRAVPALQRLVAGYREGTAAHKIYSAQLQKLEGGIAVLRGLANQHDKATAEAKKNAEAITKLNQLLRATAGVLKAPIQLFDGKDAVLSARLNKDLNLRVAEMEKILRSNTLDKRQRDLINKEYEKELALQQEVKRLKDSNLATTKKQLAKDEARKAQYKEIARLLKEDLARTQITQPIQGTTFAIGKDVGQLKDAQREINNHIRTLQDLERRYLRAGKAINSLEVTRVRKRLDSLAATQRSLRKSVVEATDSFHNLNRVLLQFFRYALGYGALYRMLGAITQLGRGILDLQSKLKGIQAVTQATEQEMVTISAAIADVALSTRFSVSEIAEAAQLLGQAGVKPKDIREVLQNTANFASAVGASIDLAADLITTFRNVFTELGQIEIADQLTKAVNISKLAANDLKTIFSLSAQTAKAYQLTSEQYLAAVTTLRDAGIKASTIATGIRQGLIEIFSPDTRSLKLLQKRYAQLGEILSLEDIKARFSGFRQTDNPLVAALRELEKLGVAGSGEQLLGRIFDVRAMNVIRALIKDIRGLEKDTVELSFGGSAAEAAAIQMEALLANLTNLGAAFTTFGYQLTKGPIESLTDFVKWLTDSIEGLSQLDLKLKSVGEEGLGSVFSGTVPIALGAGLATPGGAVQKLIGGATAGVAAGSFGIAQADKATNTISSYFTTIVSSVLLLANFFGEYLRDLKITVRKAEGEARAGFSKFSRLIAWLPKFGVAWLGWAILIFDVVKWAYDFFTDNTNKVKSFKERAEASKALSEKAYQDFEDSFKSFENLRLSTPRKRASSGTFAGQAEALSRRQEIQIDAFADFIKQLGGASEKDTETIKGLIQRYSRIAQARDASSRTRELARQKLAETLGIQEETVKKFDNEFGRLLAEEDGLTAASQKLVEGLHDLIDKAQQKIKDNPKKAAAEKELVKAYSALPKAVVDQLLENRPELIKLNTQAVIDVLREVNNEIPAAKIGAKEIVKKEQYKKELENTARALIEDIAKGQATDVKRTINEFAQRAGGFLEDTDKVFRDLILELDRARDDLTTTDHFGKARGKTRASRRGKSGVSLPAAVAAFSPADLEASKKAVETEAARNREVIRQGNDATVAALVEQRKALRDVYDTDRNLYNELLKTGFTQEERDLLKTFIHYPESSLVRQGTEEDKSGVKRIRADLAGVLDKYRKRYEDHQISELAAIDAGRKATLRAIETRKIILDREVSEAKKRGVTTSEYVKALGARKDLELQQLDIEIARLEAGQKEGDANEQISQLKEKRKQLEIKYGYDVADYAKDEARRALERAKTDREILISKKEQLAVISTINGHEERAQELLNEVQVLRLEALALEEAGINLIDDVNDKEQKLAELKDRQISGVEALIKIQDRQLKELEYKQRFITKTGAVSEEAAIKITQEQVRGEYVSRAEREYRLSLQQQAAFEKEILLANQLSELRKALGELDLKKKEEALLYEKILDEIRDKEQEIFDQRQAQAQIEAQRNVLTSTDILGDPKDAFNLSVANDKLLETHTGVNDLAHTINNQLVTGMESFAGAIAGAAVEGKSLGDTMKAALSDIAAGIAKAIIQALILKAISAGIGGAFGGAKEGGIIGSSPKGIPLNAGINVAGAAKAGGIVGDKFAGGGIIRGPGTGTSDSIFGFVKDRNGKINRGVAVSDGEGILTAKAVDLLGEDFIHKINSRALHGMASGGVIRQKEITSSREVLQKVADQPVNVDVGGTTVANFIDPDAFRDFFAGKAGEKIVINHIERNSGIVSGLIGRS